MLQIDVFATAFDPYSLTLVRLTVTIEELKMESWIATLDGKFEFKSMILSLNVIYCEPCISK